MHTGILILGILFGLAGALFALAGLTGIMSLWGVQDIPLRTIVLFAAGILMLTAGYFMTTLGYPRAHPAVKRLFNALTITPVALAAIWLGLGFMGLLHEMQAWGASYFPDIDRNPIASSVGAFIAFVGTYMLVRVWLISSEEYALTRTRKQ